MPPEPRSRMARYRDPSRGSLSSSAVTLALLALAASLSRTPIPRGGAAGGGGVAPRAGRVSDADVGGVLVIPAQILASRGEHDRSDLVRSLPRGRTPGGLERTFHLLSSRVRFVKTPKKLSGSFLQ